MINAISPDGWSSSCLGRGQRDSGVGLIDEETTVPWYLLTQSHFPVEVPRERLNPAQLQNSWTSLSSGPASQMQTGGASKTRPHLLQLGMDKEASAAPSESRINRDDVLKPQ